MWQHFSIANWWEDRRILDKICLYFLFFIWRRCSEISNTFLISLYNINDVRDLTPSRHSAIYISFNLIFITVVKICQDLQSLGTSKHQETLFVQVIFFHVRCPGIRQHSSSQSPAMNFDGSAVPLRLTLVMLTKLPGCTCRTSTNMWHPQRGHFWLPEA